MIIQNIKSNLYYQHQAHDDGKKNNKMYSVMDVKQ